LTFGLTRKLRKFNLKSASMNKFALAIFLILSFALSNMLAQKTIPKIQLGEPAPKKEDLAFEDIIAVVDGEFYILRRGEKYHDKVIANYHVVPESLKLKDTNELVGFGK